MLKHLVFATIGIGAIAGLSWHFFPTQTQKLGKQINKVVRDSNTGFHNVSVSPTSTPSQTSSPLAPLSSESRRSPSPNSSRGNAVITLDRLKKCQPFRSQPIFLIVEVTVDIKGWQGDRCSVQYLLADESWYMRCLLRQDTIALMTDEEAYREARAMDRGGNISINFGGSKMATSKALERDCQFRDSVANTRTSPTGNARKKNNTRNKNKSFKQIQQDYDRIQNMSYQEIANLLGSSGREIRRDRIVTWKRLDDATFIGHFTNNKLHSLSKIAGSDCNVQGDSVSCTSREMPPEFGRVQQDMNYLKVLQILGQPSEEKEKIVYLWRLSTKERKCEIEVGFVDNKNTEKGMSCPR